MITNLDDDFISSIIKSYGDAIQSINLSNNGNYPCKSNQTKMLTEIKLINIYILIRLTISFSNRRVRDSSQIS